jgi:DNA polymerase III delta subunit
MKITIIYGDDTVASYKRFTSILDVIRKRGWEIVHLESQTSLIESLSATSLFEMDKLYVLENGATLKPNDYKWLKKNVEVLDHNWLIYFDGIVPKKLKDILPKETKYEEFTLPKTIWTFLDSLYPGNARQALKLFHQSVESDAVELVFSLIGTQYRDLYCQTSQMPSWKKGKLQKQGQKYTNEQLKEIIGELARIDIEVKTSQAELLPSLDLLIARELQ